MSFLLDVHPGKKSGLKPNFDEQAGQSARVPKRVKLPRHSGRHIELTPNKVMSSLEVSQHVAVVGTCFVIAHEATVQNLELTSLNKPLYLLLVCLVLFVVEAFKKQYVAERVGDVGMFNHIGEDTLEDRGDLTVVIMIESLEPSSV